MGKTGTAMRDAGLKPMVLAACLLCLSTSFRAAAQESSANLQHFEPSPHAGDLLSVGTAAVPDNGFSGGAFLSYGKDLLRLTDRRWGDPWKFSPVEHLLTMDLFGAFAAWRSASFALDLPVGMYASGESGVDAPVPPASGAGLGDLRIAARYLVLPRSGQGLGLGVEAGMAFPTGTGAVYMGSGTVTGTPAVIVDYRFLDTLVALNLGYRVQGSDGLGDTEVGGGLRGTIGAAQYLFDDRVQAFGELLFLASQEEFFTERGTTLEGQLGASMCIGGWTRLFVAAGGGFLAGVGEPSFRVTGGARIERCTEAPPPADRAEAPPPADRAEAPPPADRAEAPPDSDRDGIQDNEDACPNIAGVKHQDPKRSGCPADSDRDGIWDMNDACPAIAGDVNQDVRRNGCPKPQVTREKIEISQRIEFKLGKSDLLPESAPVLDEIAQVILEHPEVLKVTIEGHTDGTNTQEYNLPLSQKRAQAVLDYMASKGVARDRLEAKGYGMSKPIADNATEEGRRINRRVEFRVQMAPADEKKPEQ